MPGIGAPLRPRSAPVEDAPVEDAAVTEALVDRYALISSADPLDRAWISLGWTPALEGERASALRDSVPWPSVTAGLEEPAWLRGPADDVLRPANWDRLDFGFLPLDGRLSLSVWGAVGPRVEATREWRVMTHTLLFGRDVFEAVAGDPFALLRSSGGPARWLRELTERQPLDAPGTLEPVRVSLGRTARQAYRAEHLREVAELRERLLASYGGDAGAMEDALARVYEALARTFAGDERTVTLREGDPGDPRLLARLAWLALPVTDRVETFFTTQQRRTRAPAATLVVLPESEWGRLSPEEAHSAGEVEAPPEGGRRFWARAVTGLAPVARGASSLDYPAVLRRAEARRWRILGRDDLGPVQEQKAWADRWAAGGDRPALARQLLALERGRGARAGGPRWRAAGHVLGLAERGVPESAAAEARVLVDGLRPLGAADAAAVVRGMVRTMARGEPADRALAGLARCLAASGDAPVTPRGELLRLLGREAPLVDPLLRDPFGPSVLFRAAAELAREADGDAEPLVLRAVAALRDPDPAIEWLQRTLRLEEGRDARLAHHVLAAGEEHHPGRFPDPPRLGEWVLAAAERAPDGSAAAGELRAWLERPAVLAWYAREGPEPALRRWLDATGVPIEALAAHHAADPGRLPRIVEVAAELGHGAAAARLLEEGLRLHPAAPWARAVEAAPARWLRQPETLAALRGDAGAATAAVRRIASELGGDTLAPREVEGILRLLWVEGGESIPWIERELPRHRAAPVLAQLFVGPTPIELGTALRSALLRLVADAHGRVETGVAPATLRARAPAVADVFAGTPRSRTKLVFLTG